MTNARASRRRVQIVMVCAITAIITLVATRDAPEPILPSADPGAFDGIRASEELRRFVADGTPRAVATPGHDAARERLRTRLTEIGSGGTALFTEQTFFARGWNRTAVEMTNILVRVLGVSAEHRPPFVLLSAHYDCVPMGPGAGDNGAGVACALEIIRALTAVPPPNDVFVLFCDGEETGLQGARAFGLEHPVWPSIGAVVNLDARGSDGPVYVFEVGADGPAHAALLSALNTPARTTSLAAEAYRRMPNGTDFTVYLRGGRPGFNLAFVGSPRNYHTAEDTIANLDPRTMNQMGLSALAFVRALSGGQSPMPTPSEFAQWSTPQTAPPIQSAVWFDLFGFFIVRWPAWLSNVAIIGSFVAMAITLRSLRRASVASLIGSIVGSAGAVVGLIVAAAAGTFISFALNRLNLVEMPWPIQSIWWGDVSLLLVGFAAVVIPSRVIARHRITRRFSPCASWDGWFGGWFVMIALVAVIAWFAPGAVHPLLVPIVVAVALTLLALRRRSLSPDWCAVGSGIAAVAMWAPLEPAFADAFGLSLGGFTAVRGALVMIACRPLCDPIE